MAPIFTAFLKHFRSLPQIKDRRHKLCRLSKSEQQLYREMTEETLYSWFVQFLCNHRMLQNAC